MFAGASGQFGDIRPSLDLVTDAYDIHVIPLDGRLDPIEKGYAQLLCPGPVQRFEIGVDVRVVRHPDDADPGMVHEGGDETALVAVLAETDQQHAVDAVGHDDSISTMMYARIQDKPGYRE